MRWSENGQALWGLRLGICGVWTSGSDTQVRAQLLQNDCPHPSPLALSGDLAHLTNELDLASNHQHFYVFLLHINIDRNTVYCGLFLQSQTFKLEKQFKKIFMDISFDWSSFISPLIRLCWGIGLPPPFFFGRALRLVGTLTREITRSYHGKKIYKWQGNKEQREHLKGEMGWCKRGTAAGMMR